MKNFQILLIALFLFIISSCKEEAPAPLPQDEEEIIEMSTLEKLTQTWTLDETYVDGINQTKGGTDNYLFSEDGVFFYKSNNNWVAIGDYHFTGSDSTALNVTFQGATSSVIMHLRTLSESQLKTEFQSGFKTYEYHYIR